MTEKRKLLIIDHMPGNSSIQSVNRAAQILYAVAGSEEGRTPRQITEALNVRSNTLHRFLRSLEEEKFLSRKTNPLRFALGPAIAELKYLDDDRHLLTLSTKVLIRCHAQIPEANLALLERQGWDVYQRLFLRAGAPGKVQRRRQWVVHPYSKASSLVFLAYALPDEAEAFYRQHPFEKEARPFWKSRRDLEDFLHRVRKLGRAVPGFADENWFRLAVPVFSPGHEVIAAVAGYMPKTTSKVSQNLLAKICVKAGEEITRKMAAERQRDSSA